MNKSIEQVKQFHEIFENLVGNISEVEPLTIRQLRIKLLFEELGELAKASNCEGTFADLCSNYCHSDTYHDGDNVNQIEELDALCDIQYVLNGKILTAGYHEIFDREFTKVHENNMSKAHNSHDHAKETIYRNQLVLSEWTGLKIEERNSKFLVKSREGKLIKPWDHKKVELNLEL